MSIKIKELPNGTAILSYDKLSIDAKKVAKSQIIDVEAVAHKVKMIEYSFIDIHARINAKKKFNIISEMNRKLNFIKRLNSDEIFCAKFIESNLSHFTIDGEYIRYKL